MNSQQIQNMISQWAQNHGFTAPYGVLTGQQTSKNGAKFLTVTFGYARTMDATVEIYNRNFMILKISGRPPEVYKTVADLQQALNLL